MDKLKNFFLILIPLLIIESISQALFLFKGEKRYSVLFRPFFKNIESVLKTVEYNVDWNYKTNKMTPGKFTHKNIEYVINSKGFRGDEFENTTIKTRVIAFGGSTTIGLESPEGKTYPAQLENLLNKNKEEYEVINMGFGSKSLSFITSLYINEAINYKPNIILIYSNRNSLLYDSGYYKKELSQKILKYTTYLQENIMTYRLMLKAYNRLNNRLTSNTNIYSPFHKKGINKDYLKNGYKNNLKEIIKLSAENNIRVILIKQAYLIKPEVREKIKKYNADQLIDLYKKDYFKSKYDLNDEENFWLIFGTILNKKLEELAYFENVIVVDPVETLIKDKKNFVDYLHLSPKGNYILANEIFVNIR